MTTDSPSPKPTRRRWLQFSLRTLMLLCLVAAIPLGYVAWRIRRGRRVLEIAKQLRQAGFETLGPGVEWWKLPFQRPALSTHPMYAAIQQADPLWLNGRGPNLFGESTFASAVSVEGFDEDAPRDPDTFWRLVCELPELKQLVVGSRVRETFRAAQAIPALNRLKTLERLQICGVLDDPFLDAYQPPATLHTLILSKVEGGSRDAWRRFFARSHVGCLLVNEIENGEPIFSGAAAIPALTELGVTDCLIDDKTFRSLVALKPTVSFLLFTSQVQEGDETLKARLSNLNMDLGCFVVVGPNEWLEYREENESLLFGPVEIPAGTQ